MAESTGSVAAVTAAQTASRTSSYRVKFSREDFIELYRTARPRIVYNRKKNHFFGFDGFLMYSQECSDGDFPGARIIKVEELSNYAWAA